MKREKLVERIKEIALENAEFFNGVSTKELKDKLESEHEINASINLINSVMIELTDSEFDCGECTLARGDLNDYQEGRFKGIHKYIWFTT